MSDNEKDRLLRIRAKKNKRRPNFLRAEYHRLKRIQTSWRRPRGIDSKMRHKLKGKRPSPNVGYRNPKDVRGLHPSGFDLVQVFNVKDLEKVDPEVEIAQIGGTVGSKKRAVIIERAEELGIHIVNPQLRREEFYEDIEDLDEYDEEDFALLDEEDEDDYDLAEVLDEEEEEDLDAEDEEE